MFVRIESEEVSVRRKILVLFILVSVLSGRQTLNAQFEEKLYRSDCRIDSMQDGQLAVEVDNLTFFRNNEYNSTAQKGYTLPGFWFQLKAVYHPLSTIKLEAGVHSIWFWGTTLYPAFAYKEIATWQGRDYAHNVHLLPFFRVHLDLTERLSFVLGNLYGGANHRLIEPLYNPELNLTSDPETGLQLIYQSKRLRLDFWLDWMTFIYRLDTHQEAFVIGNSTRFDLTDPNSQFHVYFPLQGLIQHRGGEIEITDANIQTLMNGATGAGFEWKKQGTVLKSLKTEYLFTGYYYPKGRTYQPESGTGHFLRTAMQLKDFHLFASYWKCSDFVPVFGSVFYSSMSIKKAGMLYDNPSLCHFGAEYVRTLKKGFALGIKADVFRYMTGKMYSSETKQYQPSHFGKNTNHSIEICFRMNPIFKLKIEN